MATGRREASLNTTTRSLIFVLLCLRIKLNDECLLARRAFQENLARLRRVEAQGGTPQPAPGFAAHDGDLMLGQRYTGPIWLRKLTGNEHLLPLFHHVYDVSIGLGDHWRDIYAELPNLTYLESVHVRNGLPLAALEQLERCGQLKELELPPLDRWSYAVVSRRTPLLGVRDLPKLERLHLAKIALQGESIQAAQLEQVASFRTLKTISLRNVSATSDEIESIRAKHPQVKIVAEHDFAGAGFLLTNRRVARVGWRTSPSLR